MAQPHRRPLRAELPHLVRQLAVESQKVGHVFAHLHGLHPTDLDALVHVMDAELEGDPLTPGRLAERISLSSGATTAVVDRLVARGHVVRDRDPDDRRRVLLRHAEHGREVAFEFFGPLGALTAEVMDRFDERELETARRFLEGMTAAIARHRATLDAPEPPPDPIPPA